MDKTFWTSSTASMKKCNMLQNAVQISDHMQKSIELKRYIDFLDIQYMSHILAKTYAFDTNFVHPGAFYSFLLCLIFMQWAVNNHW